MKNKKFFSVQISLFLIASKFLLKTLQSLKDQKNKKNLLYIAYTIILVSYLFSFKIEVRALSMSELIKDFNYFKSDPTESLNDKYFKKEKRNTILRTPIVKNPSDLENRVLDNENTETEIKPDNQQKIIHENNLQSNQFPENQESYEDFNPQIKQPETTNTDLNQTMLTDKKMPLDKAYLPSEKKRNSEYDKNYTNHKDIVLKNKKISLSTKLDFSPVEKTLIIKNEKSQNNILENYIKKLLHNSKIVFFASPKEYSNFLNQNLEYSQELKKILAPGELSNTSYYDILGSIEFIPSEIVDIKNTINFFNLSIFLDKNFVSNNKTNNLYSIGGKINFSKNRTFTEENIFLNLEKIFKHNILFGIVGGLNFKKTKTLTEQNEYTSNLNNYFLSLYNKNYFKLLNAQRLFWSNTLGTGFTNYNAILHHLALTNLKKTNIKYNKRQFFFISSEIGNKFTLNEFSTLGLCLQMTYIYFPQISFQGKNSDCIFTFENQKLQNVILTPSASYKINRIVNNMLAMEFLLSAHIEMLDLKEKQEKQIINASTNEKLFSVNKISSKRSDKINADYIMNLYFKNDSAQITINPRYSIYFSDNSYKLKEHLFSLNLGINYIF